MPLAAVAADSEEDIRARVGVDVPRESNLEMAKKELVVEFAALAIRIVADEINVHADIGIETLKRPPDRLDEPRPRVDGGTFPTEVLEQAFESLLLILRQRSVLSVPVGLQVWGPPGL